MTQATTGALHAIGAAFWGALFLIPYQAATTAADSRLSAVLAMLIGATGANVAASWWQSRGRWRVDWIAARTALIMAACTILGNIAVAASLASVAPAITSVVIQAQVILVALGELLLLRSRLSAGLITGALLALGGFVVMQAPWQAALEGSRVGAVWALVAAACFATMLLVTRHVVDRIDMLTVNALRLVFAVSLLAFWPGTLTGLAGLPAWPWAMAILAGLCGPTLGRLQLMHAVRYLPATPTKLITLISPLFALLLGFVFFGSWPQVHELIGGGILLSGVILPLAGHLRRRRQQRGRS